MAAEAKQAGGTSGVWRAVKPFVNGGSSGIVATCCIQPIDIVKVRLSPAPRPPPPPPRPPARARARARRPGSAAVRALGPAGARAPRAAIPPGGNTGGAGGRGGGRRVLPPATAWLRPWAASRRGWGGRGGAVWRVRGGG